MAYDVFLSHSAKDKRVADVVCEALEAVGIRVWIAPRNILPGAEWGAAIMQAIGACRVMVVIFSSASNGSKQVLREVERAVNKNVTIIPFRIEMLEPSDSMEFYLGVPHWLDAYNEPLAPHVERLVASVRATLGIPEPAPLASAPPPVVERVAAEPRTRQCPFCAEDIRYEAKLCRFCGRESSPTAITEHVGVSEPSLKVDPPPSVTSTSPAPAAAPVTPTPAPPAPSTSKPAAAPSDIPNLTPNTAPRRPQPAPRLGSTRVAGKKASEVRRRVPASSPAESRPPRAAAAEPLADDSGSPPDAWRPPAALLWLVIVCGAVMLAVVHWADIATGGVGATLATAMPRPARMALIVLACWSIGQAALSLSFERHVTARLRLSFAVTGLALLVSLFLTVGRLATFVASGAIGVLTVIASVIVLGLAGGAALTVAWRSARPIS